MRTIEPRERLHRLEVGKDLVHVHGVEQRLVVAGLELIRDNQETVRLLLDLVLDRRGRKSVQRRFGHDMPVDLLVRKGDDRLERPALLLQQPGDVLIEVDRPLDGRGDDHRPGPAADFLEHFRAEVVDDDAALRFNRLRLALHVGADSLRGLVLVKLRIVLDLLDDLVIRLVGRVVADDVENELFLDRLFHRILVERRVSQPLRRRMLLAEHLQRLVLRRRGEGIVVRVLRELAALDDTMDFVLRVFRLAVLVQRLRIARNACRQTGGHFTVLARMRLVYHNGEVLVFERRSDFVEDERELVNRRNDDLLAALQQLTQRIGAIGPADKVLELRKGVDVVANLLVEIDAVRDNDDGVELGRRVRLLQQDQLIRKPRDRIRLARPGRVLDQELAPHRVGRGLRQEPPHRVELVIARPDDPLLDLAGLLLLGDDHLREVLDDVRKRRLGEDLFPKVARHRLARNDGIARAAVHAAIERQEPRLGALQLRAHVDVVVVHGEMHGATLRLQ